MNAPARRHGFFMFMFFWAVVFVVMVYWFENVLNERLNPNKAVLLADQEGELVLKKNLHGHFIAEGYVNGHLVEFVVDTGATSVAIPANVAVDLELDFTGTKARINTANGEVVGHEVNIDSLQIGPILVRKLSGLTIPRSEDRIVLLGMNVLGDLDIQLSGDTMRLRPAVATDS